MRRINWDNVQEARDFARPVPGGYVARITNVEDKEEKEYLRIEWDFVDKPYEGSNLSAFDRLGFWPLSFVRSYKEKSLSFFKAFKTQLEASNPGYHFREDDLSSIRGKLIGVVLGEEEYMSNVGTKKTRLTVRQTRSVDAIRRGDFTVPPLKPLKSAPASEPASFPSFGGFSPMEDDGDLPF